MDSPETFKTNIHKGIQAITHIFKILLIYSNNINHTIDTTQKCFFYYVEFVTQISNSNDYILNNSLMMLLYSCIKNLYLFMKKTIMNLINLKYLLAIFLLIYKN